MSDTRGSGRDVFWTQLSCQSGLHHKIFQKATTSTKSPRCFEIRNVGPKKSRRVSRHSEEFPTFRSSGLSAVRRACMTFQSRSDKILSKRIKMEVNRRHCFSALLSARGARERLKTKTPCRSSPACPSRRSLSLLIGAHILPCIISWLHSSALLLPPETCISARRILSSSKD